MHKCITMHNYAQLCGTGRNAKSTWPTHGVGRGVSRTSSAASLLKSLHTPAPRRWAGCLSVKQGIAIGGKRRGFPEERETTCSTGSACAHNACQTTTRRTSHTTSPTTSRETYRLLMRLTCNSREAYLWLMSYGVPHLSAIRWA